MTPEKLTQERVSIIREMDAICDTYQSTDHPLMAIIEMRRNLAVYAYRLAAHVRQVYGEAGLTYLQRKYRIAESIIDARASDAKVAFNILEQNAQKMPSVITAHKEEVWAEAEKEALKSKLDFTKQVLSSMQQEISVLSHEARTTHFQGVDPATQTDY